MFVKQIGVGWENGWEGCNPLTYCRSGVWIPQHQKQRMVHISMWTPELSGLWLSGCELKPQPLSSVLCV